MDRCVRILIIFLLRSCMAFRTVGILPIKTIRQEAYFKTPPVLKTQFLLLKTSSKAIPEKDNSKDTISKEFRSMALPLLLVQLSSPILSLIDVSAVGRTSGVIQLASLGPATSICDLSMYVFATLSIVTTRLTAVALVKNDEEEAACKVNDGMTVAVVLGILWGALLLSPAATPLLTIFLPSVVDPNVLPAALAYTRIRALGFVGALSTVVLQSSSLVRRNVKLPLVAVTLASALNALGDWLLVIRLGMGVSGAAIATVIAQYVTAGILLRSQQKHVRRKCDKDIIKKRTSRVHGSIEFLRFCISPALALVGKLSVVLTVSATASACGTISLAAHQVLSSVFQMFRPMGDSLGQTMQALIPGVIGNNNRDSFDSMEGLESENQITDAGVTVLSPNAMAVLKVMCKMAITLGILDAFTGTSILGFMPRLFTSDILVAQRITSTSLLIGMVLLVHALSMMLEGLLFAVGDAPMVAQFYLFNAAIVQLIFSKVRSSGPTLTRVWGSFLGYQVLRASEFSIRLLWNQRHVMAKKQRQKIERYVNKSDSDATSNQTIVWSSLNGAWYPTI